MLDLALKVFENTRQLPFEPWRSETTSGAASDWSSGMLQRQHAQCWQKRLQKYQNVPRVKNLKHVPTRCCKLIQHHMCYSRPMGKLQGPIPNYSSMLLNNWFGDCSTAKIWLYGVHLRPSHHAFQRWGVLLGPHITSLNERKLLVKQTIDELERKYLNGWGSLGLNRVCAIKCYTWVGFIRLG